MHFLALGRKRYSVYPAEQAHVIVYYLVPVLEVDINLLLTHHCPDDSYEAFFPL